MKTAVEAVASKRAPLERRRDRLRSDLETIEGLLAGIGNASARNAAVRYRTEAPPMDDRESIASYLEHLGAQTFGTLIDCLTPRQVASYAASWVRNRLDEKHHAEVAANTPEPRQGADGGKS